MTLQLPVILAGKRNVDPTPGELAQSPQYLRPWLYGAERIFLPNCEQPVPLTGVRSAPIPSQTVAPV
jgi:hypothetical protein